MSTSASQIIDEKGGPAAVAAMVGKQAGAVRVWKHRNRFPREAWPELIRAYPDLTLDRLMKIESSGGGKSPDADPLPAEPDPAPKSPAPAMERVA